MTLTELRCIVAVAQTKNLGEAAKNCHVSQATLSAAINKLELALGVSIFELHHNEIRITEVGQKIVAQAQRALKEVSLIQEIAAHGKSHLDSPLKIGEIDPVAPHLFTSVPSKPSIIQEDFNTKNLSLKAVFELLHNTSLVAKTISANPEELSFILKQLQDPQNFRPLKYVSSEYDRELYYDPRDGIWRQRNISRHRIHHEINHQSDWPRARFGQAKQTTFTKKTAVTLLPPHAKMDFYQPRHGKVYGLLFDLNLCHLKGEKYIFPQMANTGQHWWLYHHGKKRNVHRSVSLQSLRAGLLKSAKDNSVLPPNELLVGLSATALVGIFSPVDERESRLEALQVQQKIENVWQKILPIFIITKSGIRVYSARQQQEDLQETEIRNNQLYQQIIVDCNPIFLKTLAEHKAYFRLDALIKKDINVARHILSFLMLPDLAQLCQSSKNLRNILNHDNSIFLWKNLVANSIDTSSIKNKCDLGISFDLSRQGDITPVNFARSHPEHAYRVMQSSFFSQKLPVQEQKLTPQYSPSDAIKALHGILGFFLGLVFGLIATLLAMLAATLRIAAMLGTFFIFAFAFKTSFCRSILGVSLFPLYSLGKSAWFGAVYSWKYGLTEFSTLQDAINIFHHELYHGTKIGSNAYDPWSCDIDLLDEYTIGDGQDTDIDHFFQEETNRPTIADVALRVHAQKPASLELPKLHISQPKNSNFTNSSSNSQAKLLSASLTQNVFLSETAPAIADHALSHNAHCANQPPSRVAKC